MKVKDCKMKLLCIQDDMSYQPEVVVGGFGGEELVTSPGDGLKMLGFNFSTRPSAGI